MDHRTIQDKLEAFYDGELAAIEAQEITGHMSVCGECREAVEKWRRMKHVFFQVSPPRPSENFVLQVMEKIEPKETFTLEALFRWSIPTLAFMGAALFLVFVWPADESDVLATFLAKGGSPFSVQAVDFDITQL